MDRTSFEQSSAALFFVIQNQIVCIDDLDRKPNNLDLKDVLGLISFLREQRECKVALLLNADQLGENKGDFDRLLEKVIDAKVVLNPTASEAGIIALPNQDEISVALHRNCDTLDICNIRVIKHIERLARRVDELLSKSRLVEVRSGKCAEVIVGSTSDIAIYQELGNVDHSGAFILSGNGCAKG
jgi:hypothetical protein